MLYWRRSFLLGAGLTALLATSFQVPAQTATPLRVGSKIDTEGKLLGNILVLALEANGIKVNNRVALGNTKVVRTALMTGELDIYPEYTGNGAFMLGDESNKAWKDLRAGYELVKKMDYERNKLVWLEPANANNTWAIAVRKDVATA
ncbi:MAG TPA: glycine betaine ABC transporter substrate-binding protein, partial [Rhodoferax sp.]